MQRRSYLLIAGIVVVILLFFVGALLVEMRSQREQGVALAEGVAQTVARLIIKDIEEYRSLPVLLDTLQDPRQYRHLDELIRHNLRGARVEKIKFYDDRGTLVYADKRELVGQDHSDKALLRQALRGQIGSKIVDREAYENAYGVTQESSLIETYMPVRDNHGDIHYAVEVYQNFDPMQASIHAALWRTGAFLGLMALVSLVAVGYLFKRLHVVAHEKEMLEALLPICSFCKKIRTGQENGASREEWVPLEKYFQETREIRFSHGLCQECLKQHYGDISE